MPNNLTDAEANRLLDLSLLNTDKLALAQINGDVTTAGTEVAGGSYARKVLTFPSATGRTKANSAVVNFTGMPTTDVQGWEIWDTAGTERKWWGLFNPTDATAQNAGDTVTSIAHGRVDGDKVVFQAGYVPTGLSAATTYFVVSSDADTFQCSLTLGGAAEPITADTPAVIFGDVLAETVGSTVSVAVGELSLTLTV